MKLCRTIELCQQMADLQLPERYFLGDCREALGDSAVQKLLVCANSVLEELYRDYATAIAKCNVVSRDGFVDLCGVNLCRVLSLTDAQGNNVRFRYAQGGLACESGNYVLTYAKLPNEIGWHDEVELPSVRITQRIFAYGILAEYFASLGDIVSAKVWQSKYQNALRAAAVKSSATSLPVGRWI